MKGLETQGIAPFAGVKAVAVVLLQRGNKETDLSIPGV
jgi:hypothetical protein